jgi:starch phosphorylase
MMLGLGGWRLLRAIGLKPQVCHLNEGHAAFAILERARDFMKETGQKFDVALEVTRAGNLFTTHTAVPAGFDRFDPRLIDHYLSDYAQTLGLTTEQLLALGRLNPNDASEPFNMDYLASHGSGAVNAVSRLHGEVSRQIFASLYPRWPEEEVPVGYVTNGIHVPSWVSTCADALWNKACGEDCWLGTTEALGQSIRKCTDGEIWQMRNTARQALIKYARERLARELQVTGVSNETISLVERSFSPDVLTLAFSRRFATYKRPNLLLRDPERLLRLLTNPQRPVQLILAGKAHPADEPGKAMIQEWIRFINRPEARPHVMFLSDYDMSLAEHLVQGADVWLNTPRRPWEASGTSGMKVLANGGLNVSELDGWWAEAYTEKVGWALGDRHEHGDDPAWDAAEAERLFQLLEQEVIPAFYSRDKKGIPNGWVARIRESMATLAPQFSANRTVREYTEKYYLPAFAAYEERISNNAASSVLITKWREGLERNWRNLRFGNLQVNTDGKGHDFQVEVFLDQLTPEAVQIELYTPMKGDNSLNQKMSVIRKLPGQGNGFAFRATVPASRPASDYTPRIVPHLSNVNVPLEANQILWQK